MPELHSTAAEAATPAAPQGHRPPRRTLLAISILSLLLLLTLLPPYINVNRYQRRIVSSISSSLGRPVHLDNITLNLLPFPSFTLQNFVVDEDPAFGSEPIIRANAVTARLRASSLWRRHVEFASISFVDPSVNLVHNPDGKWNLDTILLQASRVSSAPTADRHSGPAPRFPYIEATGARINLKLAQEKTPFSLTDAAFALWQPDPGQWRFRLRGTPARTDTDVSDTGRFELEATLGRATVLRDVPLTLHATWRSPPLGQTSRLLTGADIGLRGEMNLAIEANGTVGEAALHSHLHLADLRRDQFVPEHPLTIDLDCLLNARNQFHAFTGIRCAWPVAGTDRGLVALTGTIPDLRTPSTLDLQLGATRLPANTLLAWLSVASSHIPPDLTGTGYLDGTVAFDSAHLDSAAPPPISAVPNWTARATLGPLNLTSPKLGVTPVTIGELNFSTDLPSIPPRRTSAVAQQRNHPTNTLLPQTRGVTLAPTTLTLDGKEPAQLEGHFDRVGYRLHLTGSATSSRLLAFAHAVPPFGEGLAALLTPISPTANPTSTSPPTAALTHLDLTATRAWGGPQIWTDNTRLSAPTSVPTTARRKRTR